MNLKELKAIHKLQKAGFLEKHNQLIDQGLTNPWINYHHLKKYNGDIHKVILFYNNKEDQKEEKRKNALKTIENLGWLQKHQKLIENGFTESQKNLKILLKTNGDVDNSIEKLRKKQKLKFDKPIQLIMQELGFIIQFEKLKEMGYTNEKKIAKLLFKYEGNLQPILDKYLKINKKNKTCSIKKSLHKHKPKKSSQEDQDFKEKKAELKEKFANFNGKNIHDKKVLKFLSMFNGDIESAIQWLNQIKPQVQTQGQMVLESEILAQY
ncbi:unnamed protein product [Paramecium sonneborni]|uniref:UBA domain-containing protein n=1 Tax=Paramecium sonneborni TaxID=65129 RepID=A0A8S1PT67_9CILI|nr:unnamed protein product [Paramecium sonneborni]CAD8106184.1 unnamed protein product [Paramecium sonneborni]